MNGKTLVLFTAFASVLLSATAAMADPAPEAVPPAQGPPPPATENVTAVKKSVLVGNMTPRERVTTWDMNIDGALGQVFAGSDPFWSGFGRIRVGVLHIHDSLYLSLGPTYEISKLQPATFGLQGEIMHIETGLWVQAGGMIDIAPHPGFMAAAGWSLFGAEFQYRIYDRNGIGEVPAVYAKIRIPVSIIARAFSK